MRPHPGPPLLPFSSLLISAPALPSLTPHPAPSSPSLSDPGTTCVCGYPGESHLVFPSKGRKSTHRGFCTLAQGSGKYGLQRDERCFPDPHGLCVSHHPPLGGSCWLLFQSHPRLVLLLPGQGHFSRASAGETTSLLHSQNPLLPFPSGTALLPDSFTAPLLASSRAS